MSVSCRFGAVAAFCVAMLAWGHSPPPRDLRPDGDSSREIGRVRHHLEGAEMLLFSRDLSPLTAPQRAARARRITELRAYRQRGVFPHNHQLFDRRTPVFVDEHGTRCAMAYLIEQSGHGALVSRVAKTRNLAHIRDLAGDPELVAWLDSNGLALAEAARVQPEYGGAVRDGDRVKGTASAAVGAGVGAAGVALNVPTGASQNARNTRGLLGVVCGVLAAGLGAPALSEDGAVRVLGALDIGLGIASFGLGIRQLNAAGEERPWAAVLVVAPVVWRDSGGMRGVTLAVRF